MTKSQLQKLIEFEEEYEKAKKIRDAFVQGGGNIKVTVGIEIKKDLSTYSQPVPEYVKDMVMEEYGRYTLMRLKKAESKLESVSIVFADKEDDE